MATQEKMISNTGSDLDVLIHSLEFENQQYVKMIEKENQRNEYLESQEEEKLGFISELQTQITSLETDTKNNHKQLVHNKNTLESLKKSKCVLQAHKDALLKHLDILQFENSEQRREFEDTVQMYEKIWRDYEAQYKSLALYQHLQEEEQRLAQSQAEQLKWQQKKNELQSKIKAARDELDFRDWYRFCIKIAEKWVMIGSKKNELLAAVREKENLQAKLKEIREKNTSAVVTPQEPAQGLEMDSSLMETLDKEDCGENESEEDLTLVSGDGGDTGAETQKEDMPVDQEVATGTDTVTQAFSNNHTFVVQEASDTSGEHCEEKMEEDVCMVQENKRPDYLERFKPSDTSTPTVPGPKSLTRKPLQPLQLTPSPRTFQQPPAVTVPKIRMGLAAPRLQVPSPQVTDLAARKMMLPPKNMQSGPAAVSRSKPLPPKLSVPLLNIPRPCPTPSLPSRIPTVRLAVSSILSGSRPAAAEKYPKPMVPDMTRIPLPRTPLLAPPPSPVLASRFPLSLDTGKTKGETPHGGPPKPALSAPTVAASAPVTEQMQTPSTPVVTVPAPVSRLPRPVKPNNKQQPSPAVSESDRMAKGSAVTPEVSTLGAGDAPPVQQPGRTEPADSTHEEMSRSEDEEMESDTDNKTPGSSQPLSSSQLSEGAVSEVPCSNAFSPFSLDKHKQKLLEFNAESDDGFSFEQRQLFNTGDKMMTEDNTPHSTTCTSSIFNMAFANTCSEPQEQPMAPLFRGVTSPNSSTPPDPTKPSASNRDSERAGSFFSFESMDTSEPSGGLSLLSMFGTSSKQPDTGPAFNFNFGGSSSADTGNGSAFSFAFGGGGGGRREETSGSVFSLF